VIAAVQDTRPRYDYKLPDGRIVPIIHDHGQLPAPTCTFTLIGGEVVEATWVGEHHAEPSARQRLFDLFSAVRLAGCGALTLHEDMTAGAVAALQAWAAIDGLEIETLALRTPPMAVLTIRFGAEHNVKVFAALGAAS
jgi:hypothetical protein